MTGLLSSFKAKDKVYVKKKTVLHHWRGTSSGLFVLHAGMLGLWHTQAKLLPTSARTTRRGLHCFSSTGQFTWTFLTITCINLSNVNILYKTIAIHFGRTSRLTPQGIKKSLCPWKTFRFSISFWASEYAWWAWLRVKTDLQEFPQRAD